MYDLVVVGGGPAGLAAAVEGKRQGLKEVLIVERDRELGGILNQCIHNGFGLHWFGQELTGPEYASRFIQQVQEERVQVARDTMVLGITCDKKIHLVSEEEGYRTVESRAIVLAMGCRERTRGAISIPGTRPSGILTAGTAQRYINIEGFMVGRKVLILGSGDIGLIMARRMMLEGAEVLGCIELMPYSGGLTRNIVQCLHDFGIPLYLNHTIIEIKGRLRVEKAIVAKVDHERKPIAGTEIEFDCDTILLSVGLIPENELTRAADIRIDPRTGGAVVRENMETSAAGIFACGNAVHVHDLVDFVTQESVRAGAAAAAFAKREQQGQQEPDPLLEVTAGEGISYTVPQRIHASCTETLVNIFFRVNRVFGAGRVVVRSGQKKIAEYKRERIVPGEMEKIPFPRVLLEKVSGKEIEVAIEEEPT